MATLPERMIGAMKGDAKTFQEIEADPNAMGQAVMVIVIAGVAALIGNIFRAGIMWGIFSMILSLVGYAVWTILIVLIGTKLLPEPSTKADFAEGFRVIGFTASPGVFNVIAIIPYLGPLLSLLITIWSLIITVVAVREVLDYSSIGRAILVCVIAFVICLILYFVIMVPIVLTRLAVG